MKSSATRPDRLGQPTVIAALILVGGTAHAFAQEDTAAEIATGLLVLTALLALYVAPAIIAFVREHPDQWAILVANVLLGWTGIGWIGCLIWSLTAARRSSSGPSADVYASSNTGIGEPLNRFATSARSVPFEDLKRLKSLVDEGAIDQSEFEYLKLKLLQGRSD